MHMSQVTTWAWLLLQVELMTRRARGGQARDGRRDSACSGHHATRRRGDIVVSRRGIDILHAYVRGHDVGCYFCMHLRCNDVGRLAISATTWGSEEEARRAPRAARPMKPHPSSKIFKYVT